MPGRPSGPARRVSRELETRTVFVDTSVFVSQNFAFGGLRFTTLKDLCRQGKLRLLLTDVTTREVEARIEERVGDAVRSLKKVRREVNVLKPLEIAGLEAVFSNIDKDAHVEALKERFYEFLDDARCEIVKVDTVGVGSIFDLYFAKKPPFGEGKKKDEFPDAFALAALRTRCERNDERIYVVSEDGDMEKACETPNPFIYKAELSNLFELVLRDEGLATREAHERFAIILAEVREVIKHAFEEDLYMFVLDQDGEAEAVRVKDVSLRDESVVALSNEEVDYALDAEVSFEADIKYLDPDSVFYDGETRTYLYMGSVEETVRRTLEVPIEVSLSFDPSNPRANDVTQVTVNNGDALWIYADVDEIR